METVREKAISFIKKMPENVSLVEIIERLRFIDMVNKGIEDLERGNIVSHEESKRVLERWLE